MKFLVKLGMGLLSIIQKIEKARHIILSMTGNANFPSPIPTIATVVQITNQLEASMLKAKGGNKSDTTAMRDKEEDLDIALRTLAAYVESVANQNEGTAEAVIQSAGMDVRAKGTREVPDFDARATGNPGEVRVQQKAVKSGAHEFQMSTDISNPANWSTIELTALSRIVVRGLPIKMPLYFRGRVITKAGPSAWSEVRIVYLFE